MDLDSVTYELYGLRPGAFLEARGARAKQAKDAGDPASATAIKGLRRPTTSAWLANALVRRHAEDVDELLDLGEGMRQAQAALDADTMRRLSQRRHEFIRRLLEAAADAAEQSGTTLSDVTSRELQSTLEAATVDVEAGAALRSGCLVSALHYSGFGGFELPGAATVGAPGPGRAPSPSAGTRQRNEGSSKPSRAVADRAQVTEALRTAKAGAAESAEGARAASQRRRAAERELERRHRVRTAGEDRVAAFRRAEDQAKEALKAAQREEGAAERAFRAARKDLEEAEARAKAARPRARSR